MYYKHQTDGYLFSGNSGFVTDELKRLLQQDSILPCGPGELIPGINSWKLPKQVRFLYVECMSSSMGFDRQTYSIKADVMNILDTESKKNLARKSFLHERMQGSKFIASTCNLFDFEYTEGVYIIRPCGMVFCGGKDIIIVSSKDEYAEARTYYGWLVEDYSHHRNKSLRDVKVIISEYIISPLLFEGKKFHLRLYLLVIPEPHFKCKIARHFGKILTAQKPYIPDDFTDKDVHDTHVGSTSIPMFFPEHFPDPEFLPYINDQLDELELELAVLAKETTPFPEQAKAAYEVFGLDIMVLSDGSIKLLEINDRVGYHSDYAHEGTQKFTYDHSIWQYTEAIAPLLEATKD